MRTDRKKEFTGLAVEYAALADRSGDTRRAEGYRALAQNYRLLAELEAQLHLEPPSDVSTVSLKPA